ncbi:extracellular solute-binding protein [Bifidobacterium amazonense]|uniref:Extracellular solute-binding protein n=1 Tax=Bifidobacterium amazonense TaxID=2809027 RepID=A0ABS9VTX8_9BIFI|nr:extracellular solute-binding protein [Bifidobacterium amazonense]MCH9275545.1 extracellular solute-binding protein [Bifidobacterium amazonense]MCH9275580.1 extracellular solute-binding protein [Bifidobacterium amazonense]
MKQNNGRGKKKVIAGIAAVCAMATTLAGCGGDSKSSDTRLSSDGKPLVKIMALKQDTDIPAKDMVWTTELEKACDCHIEWQEVTSTSWNQQKNTTLASNDIADISLAGLFYAGQENSYPIFEDFSKHLDDMPNVKKFLENEPDAKLMVQNNEDGGIYSLPQDSGEWNDNSSQRMFINKQWLDKLGLKMPTSAEELLDVLRAFKTQDPNGNGKADEIPMDVRKLATDNFAWWDMFLMMNMTGIPTRLQGWPGPQGIYVDNGTVKDWVVSDEFKKVVKFYNTAMQEGLLPKDALTHDDSTYSTEREGDQKTGAATVGVSFEGTRYWYTDKLADQYTSLTPFAFDDTVDHPVWDTSSSRYGSGAVQVAKDAPNKATIWKIIDTMYSTDFAVQIKYGSKFVTKNSDGSYTIDPSKYDSSKEDKNTYTLNMSTYIPEDTVINGDVEKERTEEASEAFKAARANVNDKSYMPYYANASGSQDTELGSLYTNVMTYVMQTTGNWIQNGGIDKEWDDYVKKVNNAGLPRIIEIWQDIYDKQVKNRTE